MIYADKGEKKTVIEEKGSRTKVLQEFAYIAQKLVEKERKHGNDGKIIKELVDIAFMTESEIEAECERIKKEIMKKIQGSEKEKERTLEAILAIME